MATLRYSQVRAHPGGTIHYIANKDKIVSAKVHDVRNVLNYMGEPESTERVYSFSRHCSQNPDLAEKQIELNRQRYYANKKGGIQGLAEGKEELLGLHFFQSYTEADNPSEKAMNDIAMKIAEHPLFRDFAVFGANHFDKAHKHTHFFVSQFSAEGKPRKLCMQHEDYNDIRRYANRLCVEHGLSIIDLAVLRRDPEYSDWLDGVIAEGKVVVHPESEEHKRNRTQKAPTKNLYYKWMKEKEEFETARAVKMNPGERFTEKYFYSLDGNFMHNISGDPQGRVYAVPRKAKDGHTRSQLELVVIMVLSIADRESRYIKANDHYTWLKYHAKVDTELQGMYDCMRTADKMNIENPNDVPACIADVGKQMNALKREKARHENSIAMHEKIIGAYESYTRTRPLVEGVQEPQPDALSEYKQAYAILAQNQTLTDEAYAELRRRYEFEKRKVLDYDKRMPELKRQYRDLKKLEALTDNPMGIVRGIYDFSILAEEAAERASRRKDGVVDDVIADARGRSATGDKSNGVGRQMAEKEY